MHLSLWAAKPPWVSSYKEIVSMIKKELFIVPKNEILEFIKELFFFFIFCL